MNLINSFKIGVKDFWKVIQMDIKDIPYQFNVLFPKVPRHTEEERKAGIKKLVLKYLHMDGERADDYVTTGDIEERKRKLKDYNFFRD